MEDGYPEGPKMQRTPTHSDFKIWTELEIARSRLWDSQLKRLRFDANRPRRICRPFVAYESVSEIDELIAQTFAMSRYDRRYAWKEKRVDCYSLDHPGADPAPAAPLKDLRRYRKSLDRYSERYFGAPIADELHRLIRQADGAVPEIPLVVSEFPNPVQAQASGAAAYVTGADFSTPEARRQAHWRARPMNSPDWPGERFEIHLHPD